MKALIVFLPPIIWMVAWMTFGFNSFKAEAPRKKVLSSHRDLVPFSLVCSENGRFNYVTDGGYIFPLHDFATLEEATVARDEMKAMVERNKREERVWTAEERTQQNEVARAHWKYCHKSNQDKP